MAVSSKCFNSADQAVLMDKLNENVQLSPNGECKLYKGATQNGYGIVRKSINGHKQQIYAHRLVKMHELGTEQILENCSHLCHNKLCVNTSHITVESQALNNNRQTCTINRKCTGHVDPTDGHNLPQCIIFN